MNKNRELIKYIKKSQKFGLSIKEITDSLLATGWNQDEIKKAFLDAKRNICFSIFLLFFDFILNLLFELKKIIRGDIFILKKIKSNTKKELKKDLKKTKKESIFLFDKIHLFWHYFLSLVEKVSKFFDKVFFPFIRIIYLPVLLFGLNPPRKDRILKTISNNNLFSDGKENNFYDLSVFSGKISFINAFYLALEIFKLRRLRILLIVFTLSLSFAIFLFVIYLILFVFNNLHSSLLFDTLKQLGEVYYLRLVFLIIFAFLLFLFFTLALINSVKIIVAERRRELISLNIFGASQKVILKLLYIDFLINAIFGAFLGFLVACLFIYFIKYNLSFTENIYLDLKLNLFLNSTLFVFFVSIFSISLSLMISFLIKNKIKFNQIFKSNK